MVVGVCVNRHINSLDNPITQRLQGPVRFNHKNCRVSVNVVWVSA